MRSTVLLVTQLPGFKDESGKEIGLLELDKRLRTEFTGLYFGYASFQHSTDSWITVINTFLDNL